MIRFWTIGLALILGNGCCDGQTPPPPAQTSSRTQAVTIARTAADDHSEVPMQVILDIPSRLTSLKPGMAKTKVFTVLGLTGYNTMATCSAPMTRYGYT